MRSRPLRQSSQGDNNKLLSAVVLLTVFACLTGSSRAWAALQLIMCLQFSTGPAGQVSRLLLRRRMRGNAQEICGNLQDIRVPGNRYVTCFSVHTAWATKMATQSFTAFCQQFVAKCGHRPAKNDHTGKTIQIWFRPQRNGHTAFQVEICGTPKAAFQAWLHNYTRRGRIENKCFVQTQATCMSICSACFGNIETLGVCRYGRPMCSIVLTSLKMPNNLLAEVGTTWPVRLRK